MANTTKLRLPQNTSADIFIHRLVLTHLYAISSTVIPSWCRACGVRGLHTVHMHHTPPLLRPCGQRNRPDNGTCIDHQGRASLSLSRSPSVCLYNFPFMAVFPAVSWDLLSRRKKTKLSIKTPRSPLNTCHLSFVQIMARVAIETVSFFISLFLFPHRFVFYQVCW